MSETIWIAVTAVGTWCLVGVTLWMAERHHRVALIDLRVRHELLFAERWESKEMRMERSTLAKQLIAGASGASHQEIQEPVLDFFESVGGYLFGKYLLEDMVWSDFCFYVVRWWPALKAYVEEERRLNQDDKTIYANFQQLNRKMLEIDARERNLREPESLGRDDIIRFLENEAALKI